MKFLTNEHIKEPNLYKTKNSKVAEFRAQVEEIYNEYLGLIQRKKQARKNILQLEEELKQLDEQKRRQSDFSKVLELRDKQKDITEEIERELHTLNINIGEIMSDRLSESNLFKLSEKATVEHNAYMVELAEYERKLRDAFHSSIDAIRWAEKYTGYHEAVRLLDVVTKIAREG